MLKKIITLFLTLVLVIVLSPSAFAHSGRTDASGCHTNRKTGEYHCHSKSSVSTKSAKKSARTSSRSASSPICSYNAYNCSDFSSHLAAQNTYEQCLIETGKDVHDLDRDSDGVACEALR